MFRYLDQYYLKGQGEQSVTNCALEMFRDRVFKRNLEFFRYAVLEEIRKDREHEMVDIELIKASVNHFVVIDYKKPVSILLAKGNEFQWRGTKSLYVYDNEFEK